MNKTAMIFIVLLFSLNRQSEGQTNEATNQTPTARQVGNSVPYDQSNWLPLIVAAEAGSGYAPGSSQPTAYAGARLGVGNLVLNLGYDRIRAHDGASAQFSGMLPVFRVPGPQKDESKNYLRVYAEPGMGYRFGGGFGGFLSGGVMIALLSDKRLDFKGFSPYVEYQRRVPFSAPGHGDNRFTFGVLMALCAHCDFD